MLPINDPHEVNGGGAPDVPQAEPVNHRKQWLIGVGVVAVIAVLVLIAA